MNNKIKMENKATLEGKDIKMANKEKFKELIHIIKLQYNNRMYQLASGDMFLENVPQRLWELWYSNGNNELAVCNLDALYIRVKAGEEEIKNAYEKIIALKDALAHEFELIDKANITKGE